MLIEQAFPRERKYRQERYLPPKGRLSNDFEGLMGAGCIQAENEGLRVIFGLLMVETNMNPCNGCPVWDRQGPQCKAFQQYHSAYRAWKTAHDEQIRAVTTPQNAPAGHPLEGKTMKQIAEALSISLSEARRRKQAGTLFEPPK